MRPPSKIKVYALTLLLAFASTMFVLDIQAQNSEDFQIAFWNFENFFDPFVDSTRIYNEFTEKGSQHWTMSRFYKKRNNIYKTILALSDNEPIAVMGIAEVENQYVLNMVFNQTPLKKHNYRIIHYEGDDRRGIDVAMIYSIEKVQLIHSEAIKIRNPKNHKFRSRDILYGKFYDKKEDTLHVFVNHWPSRYGGEMETIELRGLAAKTLRNKVDSLCRNRAVIPNIIIMGDFNDSPNDASIRDVLGARPKNKNDTFLINLFTEDEDLGFEGTLKHKYHWQIFDQIIVSKSMMERKSHLKYKKGSAMIFHADFLFQTDETYGGVKLFRTYVGPRYVGGFSDHLPVRIYLER